MQRQVATALDVILQILSVQVLSIACIKLPQTLTELRAELSEWRPTAGAAKEFGTNRPNILVVGARSSGKTSLVQTVLSSLRDSVYRGMQLCATRESLRD